MTNTRGQLRAGFGIGSAAGAVLASVLLVLLVPTNEYRARLWFLLAAGCFYWGRRRVQEPTPVKPQAPVWIWSGGNVMKWHAVLISQDSVSGIPYRMSLKCDSCRRNMPWAEVDSMKLGYHTVAELITFWGGLLILSGIAR